MKNGLNKFAKGMFAIFTIKVVLFSLIFINQSCENNPNELESNAKENFLSALATSKDNVSNISVNKVETSNLQARDLTDGTLVLDENVTKLCLDEPIDNNNNDSNTGLTLGNVLELDLEIIKDTNGDIDNNGDYCYEIDENEALTSLSPALEQAKNYLMSIGISELELIEEFGETLNDPAIITTAIIATQVQSFNTSSNQYSYLNKNNINLFAQPTFAYTMQSPFDNFIESKAGRCLGAALGITAIRTLINSTIALTEPGIAALQILKHIGLRYLGAIGVAYAVYSFSKCVSQ